MELLFPSNLLLSTIIISIFENNNLYMCKNMNTMNTSITDLYIIGNGFDLHHGINSSYFEYRIWLKNIMKIYIGKL